MKITPVDSAKEIEGSILPYRGVNLVVARSNNVNFKKVFRDALAPHKASFDDNTISDYVSENIMINSVASSILVGWSDFIDIDGKEWEYSVDNAKSLLKDDKDAYDAVIAHSEKIENYLLDSSFKLKEG